MLGIFYVKCQTSSSKRGVRADACLGGGQACDVPAMYHQVEPNIKRQCELCLTLWYNRVVRICKYLVGSFAELVGTLLSVARTLDAHHHHHPQRSQRSWLKPFEHSHFQKLACSPEVDKDDMKHTLEAAIKANGLETEIRNVIYHLIRNSLKPEPKASAPSSDPLNYLRRAGIQWERRVRKSLNSMCSESKAQLQGQMRIVTDREDILAKWDELSNYQIDLTNYRPVYAPKDLLDVLLSLKGPVKQDETEYRKFFRFSPQMVASQLKVIKSFFSFLPKWEFSHISLTVKNLFELRVHFSELLRNDNTGGGAHDWPVTCQKILKTRHAPLCQQALKKGITPPPLRGPLWAYVLGSQVEAHHTEHWENLKQSVLTTESIVDKLVFKDVQLTATNDDRYFVFEDVLYQIMLCFSRDDEISHMIQTEFTNSAKLKQYEGPACGFVPFHGICMLAAPFCYLYDNPVSLYFTFRAFYVRYCHRLTTINTHPQGIVSLCLLFEKLLQTHEPQLWSHFRELQIQPIASFQCDACFSGHCTEQCSSVDSSRYDS
ncbi:TBC1 domain family member 19 [Culex quinquefasciatus]|uniref:TBC1 domain family member 19 n=1 Tax=Culex quinquefasciatus TaxID=7176 RepID=B0XL41_CULQU|nr:TBC1 domain family member 19 [Culex quinquefasciatus]|eukprot:XP_001870363.1 TBC1 domain family member 19 [Culex quinquefasciatus]